MPVRIAKAFYKSKTILTNVVLICTGVAGIFTDVGLESQAGVVMVAAGVLNTALRWISTQPLSLLGGEVKGSP